MTAANINVESTGIGRPLSVFQAPQSNPTVNNSDNSDNSELLVPFYQDFYQDARSVVLQCHESAFTAPSPKCEKPLTAELQGRETWGL